MTIDHSKTMENLKLINTAELARRIGVTPPLIHYVASGKYKFMKSPKAMIIISALRDLNMLAESEDQAA